MNLMGVNNEKEPLTGISPVSLLFDRSLNKKYGNFIMLQYKLVMGTKKQTQLYFFSIKHSVRYSQDFQ